MLGLPLSSIRHLGFMLICGSFQHSQKRVLKIVEHGEIRHHGEKVHPSQRKELNRVSCPEEILAG